jgi:hypothetical protein
MSETEKLKTDEGPAESVLMKLLARFLDTSMQYSRAGRCDLCGDPGNFNKVRHNVCTECWETLTGIVANEIRNMILLEAWTAEGHDPAKFIGCGIVDEEGIEWAKKELERLRG